MNPLIYRLGVGILFLVVDWRSALGAVSTPEISPRAAPYLVALGLAAVYFLSQRRRRKSE